MRNLLALLGLAVVTFAGLGWYLGWYHVAVSPGTDGNKKIELDVNTSKVQTDVSTGIEKGKEFIDTFRKDRSPAESAPDFVGPPRPANPTPATGTTGPVPFK